MRVIVALGCFVTVALVGCADPVEPAPAPTLRAAHCFDGTLEKGCPDFSYAPPRALEDITVLDESTFLFWYTDGTTETVEIGIDTNPSSSKH